MSFSSTSPWASGKSFTGKSYRNGPFPRRSFEIGAIVVAFIYWWPLALGYVVWKLSGYPAFSELRDLVGRTTAAGASGRSRFAAAFEATNVGGTGNLAFDAYRKAEIERLVAQRRALDEEGRAFAAFVEELKRAKDREQFDAFMAQRRAAAGSKGTPDA
ncbi:DUF2852 domain-containing protein [Methylobacterium sp. Leaf108]|uniref:DUF2852 domain-containing protein n=1 Tax=Methylobacterium sp. Leaf108 TaxID=1736256 RepID=UPI0006FAFEF1|nr:DUF2852 domain-containing protein [Methylobacterium sp. Leaf108]KQP51805.1 hypothetical protein ASF39_08540 [Methylobacterium sp. Leaf108]